MLYTAPFEAIGAEDIHSIVPGVSLPNAASPPCTSDSASVPLASFSPSDVSDSLSVGASGPLKPGQIAILVELSLSAGQRQKRQPLC